MRNFLVALAVFGLMGFAANVSAQTTQPPKAEIKSPDNNNLDRVKTHDRPTGNVVLKVPAPANPPATPPEPSPAPPPSTPTPPSEGEDIPPSETPPDGPPAEEPPTYYGEPVSGKFAFVLDASGSMSGSKMAALRSETTGVITALVEADELDCVAYGTQFPAGEAYSKYLWQGLLPATDGNKSAAVNWVNGPSLNPGGGTPSYPALKKACLTYPSDLTKMFFVTDGYPNPGGSSGQILADFPGWWGKFEETELVCVCIGGGGASFMQQLAALAGGTYVAA
jgi:hypothetical protein